MVNGVAQEFNGGVLAGLSTSEISGDYITGPSKAGLYIGIFTSHYVSSKSSLQLELNFIQKGSRKNPDTLDLTSYILRLNYLTIIFLYKYDIKKFTFEIGPSLGYLVHSYEEADYFVLDNPFNPLDFSGELGLSYAISRNLRFNIRYSNTLFFPVRDEPSGYTYFLRKGQYNEVLSFTFHYTIFNTQK
jgi:hypothetical protein